MFTRRGFIVLSIFCILLFSFSVADALAAGGEETGSAKLVLFYSPTCSHCKEARQWLDEEIKPRYPSLVVEEYEASKNIELYERMAAEYNTSTNGVPRMFISGKVFVGFQEASDGELSYNTAYRAYIGYSNQIETAIEECLNCSCSLYSTKVVEISMNDGLVAELLSRDPNAISSTRRENHTYLVAWWSLGTIFSLRDYPDVLVYVDTEDGSVIRRTVPSAAVDGMEKPVQGFLYTLMLALLGIYALVYLAVHKRSGLDKHYWIAGFAALLIVTFFVLFATMPTTMIEGFARSFPFPLFVFVLALADGFNPCAFTVLIVLLSLLTHTKSKRKMALVGGVFILTSAVMYFVSIMVLTLVGSMIFESFGNALYLILGAILVVGGLINIKDYFFFGKGVSLSISEDRKRKIYKKAGKIVKNVDRAESKTALAAALGATVVLAVMVNLVELGCTAMLPMVYTPTLISIYGESIGPMHIFYTLFYSLVYVLPLFAILGNFMYTFRSERLTESQGRALKLAGGLTLLVLGAVMLLRPDLLTMLG